MIGPSLVLAWHTLRVEARIGRGYAARFGLALLCLGNLLLSIRGLVDRSAPGLSLLQFQIWTSFLVITVLAVSNFSALITEEREQGTLGLLKLAGFRPVSILLGKSLRVWSTALLLLAVQLPFSVLCIALGGVSVQQVMVAYELLVAQLLFTSCLGLCFSVLRPTARQASSFAYLTLILLYVLPEVGNAWFTYSPPGNVLEQFAAGAASVMRTLPTFRDLTPVLSGFVGAGVPTSVTVSVVAALALFALSWMLFERMTQNLGAPGAKRPFFRNLGPMRRVGGRSLPVVGHPLSWKDYQFITGGRWALLFRALLLVAAMVFFRWTLRGGQGLAPIAIIVGLLAISFEGLQVFSRAFAFEREQGSLSVLGTLPISRRQLVIRKLLGGLRLLLPSSALLLGGGLAFSLAGPSSLAGPRVEDLLDLVASLQFWLAVTTVAFTWLLGLYLSLVVRRAAGGLAISITAGLAFLCILVMQGNSPELILGVFIAGNIALPTLIAKALDRRFADGA